MNENINLCEILKGHEDEVFYSTIYGEVRLIGIDSSTFPGNSDYPIVIKGVEGQGLSILRSNGHFLNEDRGECVLFPSKGQRDWNKWVEEQKSKVPKTWSELVKENKYQPYFAEIHIRFNFKDKCAYGKNPIEKSAAALLKIYQLIEVGYGGNVSDEEYNNKNIRYISYYIPNKELLITDGGLYKSHIAFHTKEQAKEFLKYPENVQLLKDYFMI